MNFEEIKNLEEHFQAATYAKMNIVVECGSGAWIWTSGGEKYLDLYGGHAVCATGHSHPLVVEAIQKQAEKVLFYSNLVYSEIRAKAAEKLVEVAPDSITKTFFCNSGTEANENAMRMARFATKREKIITFSGGFHGRTADAISATFLGKYREIGRPNVPEHYAAEFGNLESVREIVDEKTAAIMLEPIQSMAGMREAKPEFFRGLRKICNEFSIVLIFDEVQTGIGRFKGKTFVVKFSGKVTEDKENLASLAEELGLLHQVGIRLCLIHGGGKQLNEIAKRLGVAQTVIDGRRVTDDETLELAKMIFAGKINTEILAALRQRGVEAVGLSGVDGNIVHAVRRPPKDVLNRATGENETIDFGHVGDVLEINDRLLQILLDKNYLPVISSLGADDAGQIFNINADTIAAEIAVRLQAEKLVLLSDVGGIYLLPDKPETKISRVSVAEAEELIENGTASGGMIPKLQNITELIRRGVKSAHIISGTTRNALLSEVFTDSGTGTMIE